MGLACAQVQSIGQRNTRGRLWPAQAQWSSEGQRRQYLQSQLGIQTDPSKSIYIVYRSLYKNPLIFVEFEELQISVADPPSGTRGNVNLPAARSAAVLLRSAFPGPSSGHHPTDLNLAILEAPGAANPAMEMRPIYFR